MIGAASVDTGHGNGMRDTRLRSADFLDDCARRTSWTTRPTPRDHPPLDRCAGRGPDRWTVHGDLSLRGIVRPVGLDLARLGTGAAPWGGTRAAFRATADPHREDFAITDNQVVRAGIAAIGTTPKAEPDIQAAQGEWLPRA